MSFQKSKTDPILGHKVQDHLISLGIHTPTTDKLFSPDGYKVQHIQDLTMQIWDILGLDMTNDSLAETPARIAKMMVYETMWGLKPENFPKCTTVENQMQYSQMVTERNITVMSQCEHHGVVIDGLAHVSYIPKDKVLGLSKLNRIVEYFSRRPQVQERLTNQIGETIKFILGTDDVAVVIDAVHYCVKSRGVGDQNSSTSTSFLSGSYKKDNMTRKEFFDAIKRG